MYWIKVKNEAKEIQKIDKEESWVKVEPRYGRLTWVRAAKIKRRRHVIAEQAGHPSKTSINIQIKQSRILIKPIEIQLPQILMWVAKLTCKIEYKKYIKESKITKIAV